MAEKQDWLVNFKINKSGIDNIVNNSTSNEFHGRFAWLSLLNKTKRSVKINVI